MQQNYSEDDLLNYIYKETTQDESMAIENAIAQNESLKSICCLFI